MNNDFDVFDEWGNKIGKFTPAWSFEGIVGFLLGLILWTVGFFIFLLIKLTINGFKAAATGNWGEALLNLVLPGSIASALLLFTVFSIMPVAAEVIKTTNNLKNPQPQAMPTSGNIVDRNQIDYGYPMTTDAFSITDMGDGSILYYTKLPQEDVLKFYRDEYTAKGYKEREILTSISDGVFSIVFDGDPSGKAVIIQSVDLGDGSRTVTILLEDI